MSAARDFITHHRQGDMAVVKGMHEPRPSINGDWHGTCRHSARTRSRGPLDGVGKTPSPGLLAGARRACRQLVLRLHAGALPTPSGSLTKALVRSASDSPLEERGFELLVPLFDGNAIEHTLFDAPGGTPPEDTLAPAQGETSGSKPFCSSGESANGSSTAEATPHSPLTAIQWQSEMNYAPESRNFVGARFREPAGGRTGSTAAPRPRSH
jgi:hypothetical protein